MSEQAGDEGGDRGSGDDRQRLGRWGERLAADYLERHGYRVLERNVWRREGEIDLVAVHGETLVFVEVRIRRRGAMGKAVESLTPAKQRRLRKLATVYSAEHPELPADLRIDLVAIELGPDGRLADVQHVESAVEE